VNRSNSKRLILIELNEINFDVVSKYCALDEKIYPNLRALLWKKGIRTKSEKQYHELEPWIQWASVHTSKSYPEHGIFRLGDIVGSGVPQIFEQLEQAGFRVGAISPMNAENRLKDPAYFIPDPWTQTPADSSRWSQMLSEAISQAVNDNSHARITAKSALQVLLGLLRFARVRHYREYFSLVTASRNKPWLKALVLDLLLHDVHWSMFNKKAPNFSTLFLNAGAHIQHHYFFNAKPLRHDSGNRNPAWYVKENEDPLADALNLYDMIVGEYFARTDTEVMLATGLTQKPYDRVKFDYRLKAHGDFLRGLGIVFADVFPRMTRDFLVEFASEQQALEAQNLLASIRVEGDDIAPLFGEIDNRGSSLFVTLTYPQEVTAKTKYCVGDRKLPLLPIVSFVALKNGMHQEDGFAYFTSGLIPFAPLDSEHCSQIGLTIKKYFNITC
jgi:hypothetical protein